MHALGERHPRPLGSLFRRCANAFDRYQATHIVGIDAGIAQRDISAERMTNDRDRRQFLLMDQLGKVIDKGGDRVVTVGRPLAVTMSALFGGLHVPVAAQCGGNPVPIAAVIPASMQEHQRRCLRISPIDIVQPQTLREVNP